MSDVELRIEELTKILNDANYSYYVNANSIITESILVMLRKLLLLKE